MRSAITTLCITFAVLLACAPAAAETLEPSLQTGITRLGGDTTYQIGGQIPGGDKVHFPISELAFPLDTWCATVRGQVELIRYFRFSATVNAGTTKDAGNMEDSDWGYYWLNTTDYPTSHAWASPSSLDIYSESTAELSTLTADARFDARFYRCPTWSIGAALGYRRQHFDFEIRDTMQYYPSAEGYFPFVSPPANNPQTIPGKTLTYEVTNHLPYAGLFVSVTADSFTLEVLGAYSPYAKARDKDDHLLRHKVSEGDTEGRATLVSIDACWQWTPTISGLCRLSGLKMETDGLQTQTQSAYTTAGGQSVAAGQWQIEQKITSTQFELFLGLGFNF